MREFDARVINTTVPAVGRTTYTTANPVGGVPVGAIIHVAGVTTYDAPGVGLSYCVGYADSGESEVCLSVRSRDNVATSSAKSNTDDSVIRLMRDNGAILAEATVKTWVTDGIELDFTIAVVGLKMSITLIFGTATSCAAWRGAGPQNGFPTAVSIGFQPDVVITTRVPGTLLVEDPHAVLQLGLAGSTGINVVAGMASKDAVATTATNRSSFTPRLGFAASWPTDSPSTSITTIGNYGVDGFDLVAGGLGAAAPAMIGLAIKLPTGHAWSITGPVKFTTTSGAKTLDVGHKSAFVYTVNSLAGNAGSFAAGAIGLGVCDAQLAQSGFALTDQNAQATSNTSSLASAADWHYLMGHDQVLKERAHVTGFTSTQVQYGVSTASNGRHWAILSIAESPYTIVGAGSLSGLSMAASVTVTTATTTTIVAAGSVPSVSGAAVAAETFTAVAAGVVASLAGAGVVGEAFAATGAGSVPQATSAGVLAEGFTAIGAGALSGPTMAAVVTHTIPTTITAAGAVPSVAGTGAIAEGFAATGAGSVQAATGAGVLAETFPVAGAGHLAPLTGSGVASLGYAATVAGSIPALSSRGFVAEGFTVAGAGEFGPLTMAASVNSGATTVAVAGAVPPLSMASAVAEGFAGTVTGSIQATTGSGALAETFTAVAAGALVGISGVAAVSAKSTATVAGSIGALTMAAALSESFTSNATGVIQGPTMVAVVTQTIPITIMAQGALAGPTMSAVVTLTLDVSSIQLTYGAPETVICAGTATTKVITYDQGTLNQLSFGLAVSALVYTPPTTVQLTYEP